MRRINVLREVDGTARVAGELGGEQIGASVHTLAEGQSSAPYHFHHGVEEWLIVLGGSPTVRTPEGERTLRPGDTLCFPVGTAGAHEITGPGTILLLPEIRDLDVVEQLGTGTVELRPAGRVFREESAGG